MATKELSIGVILIALLVIIFNPWQMFMPGYMVMGLLIGLIVLYIAFATFIWRENRGDEREAFHRLFADRIAYLTGSAVLLVGIVANELSHRFDPWLIAALVFMVFAKVVGLIYGKNRL
jgi:heme O synthase-like polyprenyltransferase